MTLPTNFRRVGADQGWRTRFDEIADSAWPQRAVDRRVIYGGSEAQERSYARVVPWTQIHDSASPLPQ